MENLSSTPGTDDCSRKNSEINQADYTCYATKLDPEIFLIAVLIFNLGLYNYHKGSRCVESTGNTSE